MHSDYVKLEKHAPTPIINMIIIVNKENKIILIAVELESLF